tara:strand:+ start:259 stop:936 length:678 start_codon:yes stop_codon:yes gene_type:complete
VVTSISGNNVTWRDSKTGNLITDIHKDLELANIRRNKMPYSGRNGSNGKKRTRVRKSVPRSNNRNNRNNMNTPTPQKCPPGQHWMGSYCMNDSDMPSDRDPTLGGRVKNPPGSKYWPEAVPPSPQAGTSGRPGISYNTRKPRRQRSSTQQSSRIVNRQKMRSKNSPRRSAPRQGRLQEQMQSSGRYFHRDGSPYLGKVVKQGNLSYTTTSGTMQGNSVEVFTRKP